MVPFYFRTHKLQPFNPSTLFSQPFFPSFTYSTKSPYILLFPNPNSPYPSTPLPQSCKAFYLPFADLIPTALIPQRQFPVLLNHLPSSFFMIPTALILLYSFPDPAKSFYCLLLLPNPNGYQPFDILSPILQSPPASSSSQIPTALRSPAKRINHKP